MLIRFGAKNHLSIRNYEEISFVASSAHDDLDHVIRIDNLQQKEKEFLPLIALYGANAAGKSNILDAMKFLDLSIYRSYSHWEERKTLPHHYFSLDGQGENNESAYDCDVLIDNIRYQYGFALNKTKVLKEWLYSYPKGSRNILFQRDFSEEAETSVYFGASLKKINSSWKKIAENTRILLLSAAGKKDNEHPQLTPVFKYFKDRYKAIEIKDSNAQGALAMDIQEENIKEKLVSALKMADFGIVDIEIETINVEDEEKKFLRDLTNLMKQRLPDSQNIEITDDDLSKELRINFIHQGINGESYKLAYANESSGTRYLLNLLVPVISALENGKTLIVDEITTNLHTKLSEQIMALFTSREINKKNAQFIFSTHDTNLLSRQLLRRDEIWFAEKNDEGATCIYPLTDFKTRKADNIEKGYLQGRYGAIPFIGDIGALLS